MTSRRKNWWRLALAVTFLATMVLCLTVGREPLLQVLGRLRDAGPLVFFTVFALSISLGVPPTPFLLAAGAAFELGVNVAGLLAGYLCSLTIAYLSAERLFKKQLQEYITHKTPWISRILQDNPRATMILIRLTPGLPYILQNCLVATISRSFAGFLALSLPPLLGISLLYVSLGKNLVSGKYLAALPFFFLLVILGFVLKIATRHQNRLGKTLGQ